MSTEKEYVPFKQNGDMMAMAPPADTPPPRYPEEKLKYPKSVFFIIGNEFCERFSYYGMRTILSLYLTQALLYSESTATIIYHTFVMLCYFTPLIGGIMADSWLGKYRTILYVSLFYALGNIVLSVGSVTAINIPHAVFSLVGLLLISCGTGGIKPCVSSFGGDQFVEPQQTPQLKRFFSVFYFSINAGSVISCFLTPILRENVKCFGENNCYPLAFGIPAVLMCLSVVIFICGRPMYKIKKPEGNIAYDVVKCIGYALVRKVQTQKMEKKSHWLDYAAPKYNTKLIEETKILMRIIYLFTPTIIFWALYEQQGSKWTFQANNMDGNVNGWFTIQPDQMQTINPVLCLIFIPIFESGVYPLLEKLRLVRTPLQKLSWGGILAAVAFLISGFLDLKIEQDRAIVPSAGEAQLRLYNTFNCPIHIEIPEIHLVGTLPALDTIEFQHLSTGSEKTLKISTSLDKSCNDKNPAYSGTVEINNKQISSYIFTSPLSLEMLSVNGSAEVQKSLSALPKIKVIYGEKGKLDVKLKGPSTQTITVNDYQSDVKELEDRGTYTIIVAGQEIKQTVELGPGAVYTLMVTGTDKNMAVKLFTITKANSVNLMWQLPQYFVITFAEIMFSITGLEFSFTQSPTSMKSVISSIWLLTDSIGNIIVLVVEGLQIFDRQAYEFFLFAGLMTFVMIIFIIIAMNYKYVTIESENDSDNMNTDNKDSKF